MAPCPTHDVSFVEKAHIVLMYWWVKNRVSKKELRNLKEQTEPSELVASQIVFMYLWLKSRVSTMELRNLKEIVHEHCDLEVHFENLDVEMLDHQFDMTPFAC